MTGATGSLGSFLVDQLLSRPSVKRIYCLNRKTEQEATSRQLEAFLERGLDVSKLEAALGSRVLVHAVDLSRKDLGLSDADYEAVSVRSDLST